MTVTVLADVTQTQLWPQRDARDPLGIWGGLAVATGDASGGLIDIFIQANASIRAAYVYNIISANVQKVDGASINEKAYLRRIITHWPDISVTAGVQSYEDVQAGAFIHVLGLDPENVPATPLIQSPQDRFMIFDPRPIGAAMTLVELRIFDNELNQIYRGSATGYFWDRAVMETPGGPRFPGSS